VQYWLYWYFNRFNDKHESDWEMIQVVFDNADTVEEALAQEPTRVAYAQHGGGEAGAWTDPKLHKEDGHPVIYSASGSHASFYGSAIWMGWGEHGTGLGCDITTAPSIRQPLMPILIPTTAPDYESPYAWINFGGLWGEKQAWVFDGPAGPNMHRQWLHPISWTDGLRHTSLKASDSDSIGIAPANVFCNATAFISSIFTLDNRYPIPIYTGLACVIAAFVALFILALPTLLAALDYYATHAATFLGIGLVIVPVGIAASLLHLALTSLWPFSRLIETADSDLGIRLAVGLLAGAVQVVVILLVVCPAVTHAIAEIRAGRRPHTWASYRVALRRSGASLAAAARWLLCVGGLALTVIGIPWAIRLGVRWSFFDHAIILDGATPRAAFTVSARAVRSRWWQALAVQAILLMLLVWLGPVVGVILLINTAQALPLINLISGVVFACTVPLAAIATSIWYLEARPKRDA
jgi:hypothetical protein